MAWGGFWHQLECWSGVRRHKSALFVKMEAGKCYLEASCKNVSCVVVYGLASCTTSCLTKGMLGDGDRENTVAIVSHFSLWTSIKENVPTSCPHPLWFSLIWMPMVFVLSAPALLSVSWFDKTSAAFFLSSISIWWFISPGESLAFVCSVCFCFFILPFFSLSPICFSFSAVWSVAPRSV